MTAKFIAAGDLGGNFGQIQVFAIQSKGQIESRWKQTPDPDSAWTAWASFQTPSGGVDLYLRWLPFRYADAAVRN
jgi:hypothetical protein